MLTYSELTKARSRKNASPSYPVRGTKKDSNVVCHDFVTIDLEGPGRLRRLSPCFGRSRISHNSPGDEKGNSCYTIDLASISVGLWSIRLENTCHCIWTGLWAPERLLHREDSQNVAIIIFDNLRAKQK